MSLCVLCVCACPCLWETGKVEVVEVENNKNKRETVNKKSPSRKVNAGNEKLTEEKWEAGDGGPVCQSPGTSAACSPSLQRFLARHKQPNTSAAPFRTGWQESKALPLNHIKVSVAQHWKTVSPLGRTAFSSTPTTARSPGKTVWLETEYGFI